MKKICFLYIDEPYNIYHSISIAIELHNSHQADVSIFCTERNYNTVSNTLKDYNTSGLKIKIIRPFWHITLPHYLEIKLQFRYFLYSRYRKILSNFDGIVCSLYNDLLLKKFLSDNSKAKLIFAGHGVANRSYSYDDKIKDFDYLLLSGQKEKEIRQSLNQLSKYNHSIIGYVKHDICKNTEVVNPFSNDKPIVFYNPHWLKEYSSFYKFGFSILEQFAKQDKYNLICAPHSLLTTRNKAIIPKIMGYHKNQNIHIDLGSKSCHDMSYIKISDIYLGDISSQALEFLLHKKRPCLYIDINGQDGSKSEFHSWELGDIITDADSIITKLDDAKENHKSVYLKAQETSLEKLFYTGDKTASEIAASAIIDYLSSVDSIS